MPKQKIISTRICEKEKPHELDMEKSTILMLRNRYYKLDRNSEHPESFYFFLAGIDEVDPPTEKALKKLLRNLSKYFPK